MSSVKVPNVDRLSPNKAALIVIDVQNDFCHPHGLQATLGNDVLQLQKPLTNISRLMSLARGSGVPIFIVRTEHSPETDTVEWRNRHPDPNRTQNCQKDSWGAELYEFDPDPSDIIIIKRRYSAFTGTALESILKSMAISSLMFTGVTTPRCVETSVRDAVCLDFLTTTIEDCCGAYSNDAHKNAIQALDSGFGIVRNLSDIESYWRS